MQLNTLKLQKFMQEHSDWEQLLSKEPYNLKLSYDDNYIILKYDQLASDFSLELVKEARGIIFDTKTLQPVCVPFFKFMNAEEENSDLDKIDWSLASVQQKIDGSLIKVWYNNEKWHISTNGTIDAFKAKLPSDIKFSSYGELFVNELESCSNIGSFDALCKGLDKDYTYMFELITEYNRVVVPANNYSSSIYLLGCRNNKTLKEQNLDGTELAQIFVLPKRYSLHSYEEVKHAAAVLPWDDEGYVVCDKDFNRVKIKSPEYIRVHHLSNNKCVTAERLVSLVLENEVDEFLSYYPDYIVQVNLIKTKLAEFKQNIYSLIKEINPWSFASRRDYAEVVKTKSNKYQRFLFRYNDLENQFSKVSAAKWVELLEL